MSTVGFDASAIARATCLCSPCESEPTSSFSFGSIAHRPAAWRARSRSSLSLCGTMTGLRWPLSMPRIER